MEFRRYLARKTGGAATAARMEVELNGKQRLRWEKQLLARAAAGDAPAITELYNNYAPLIFSRVLLPKLGQREAAEDALSETFRTALEKLDQYTPQGTSVYFWLARIATNKALDMHRARGVTGRALTNLETQLGVLLEPASDPDTVVHHKRQYGRLRERLEECLASLNPRYRRAIELRFLEELSRERAASLLEVKLGTFDVLLLRALKSLRKYWVEAETNDKEPISVRLG